MQLGAIDITLGAVFLAVVAWAVYRGFFASALQLGAWIASIAVAGTLSNALAPPLYEAFAAEPARRMIEAKLGGAVSGSQAAGYAREVIASLPEAVTELAARFAGLTPEALIANMDRDRFSAANAAALLEGSIVAPIGAAVIRLGLSAVLFLLLIILTRLVVKRIAKLRKLPVLKQADRILGAGLGLAKGALLLYALCLALRAAAALELGGPEFARAVDNSFVVKILDFRF